MTEPTPLANKLEPFKTFTYKTIGDCRIRVDVYTPVRLTGACPIFVYYHGGGWTKGSRKDYNKFLFKCFLMRGYVVCSMDYRLVPEVNLSTQLEDIKDSHYWLTSDFPGEMASHGIEINCEKIIVGGASSGAHLALCTPRYWLNPPDSILVFYGPTDLHDLKFQDKGRLSERNLELLLCTPSLLESAIRPNPISETPFSRDLQVDDPRFHMFMHVLRKELVAEFLINGLRRGEEGRLELPKKGSAPPDEVEKFNPLDIIEEAATTKVCFITGTEDEVFDMPSHASKFEKIIREKGGHFKLIKVEGQGHSFDLNPDTRLLAENCILVAVKWIHDEMVMS